MPLYDFFNSETGEEFEKMMPWADMKQYLLDNPHIQQRFYKSAGLGYSMESWVNKRLPQDYRRKLEKIKKENKGSTVNDR